MKKVLLFYFLVGQLLFAGIVENVLKAERKGHFVQAMELLENACKVGDSQACWELGYRYSSRFSGRENRQKAKKLFVKACDGGVTQACFILDVIEARKNKQDNKVNSRLAQKCENNDFYACRLLGDYHDYNKLRRDQYKANQLYKKACNGGDAKACFTLAINTYSNRSSLQWLEKGCSLGMAWLCDDVAQRYRSTDSDIYNPKKARSFYKKACDYGWEKSCKKMDKVPTVDESVKYLEKMCVSDTYACDTLGTLYFRGSAIPKSTKKAIKYFKDACEREEPSMYACTMLGRIYLSEEDGNKNENKAFKMLEKSCSLGFKEGCMDLGWAYFHGKGIRKDSHKAFAFYEKACNMRSSEACYRAGGMQFFGEGDIKTNKKKAFYFIEKACKDNHVEACQQAADMLVMGDGVPKDENRSFVLYEKVCSSTGRGCASLGLAYMHGTGIKMDKTRGVQIFKDACKNDNLACYGLGYIYSEGDGVKRDQILSQKYFKKACKGGIEDACKELDSNK